MKRLILAGILSVAMLVGGVSSAAASGTTTAFWATVTMCSFGGVSATCAGEFGGGITYKFTVFFTKFEGYNIYPKVEWNGHDIQESKADPGNSITDTGVSCYPGQNEYVQTVAQCTGTYKTCVFIDCTPFGESHNHYVQIYLSTADGTPRETTGDPNCGNDGITHASDMCVKSWNWSTFS